MKKLFAGFLFIPIMFVAASFPFLSTSANANTVNACEDDRDTNAVLAEQLYRSRFLTERDAAGLVARFAKDKKILETKIKDLETKLKTLEEAGKKSDRKK